MRVIRLLPLPAPIKDWVAPPPKISPIPDPLPDWIRTTKIRAMQLSTWTKVRNAIIKSPSRLAVAAEFHDFFERGRVEAGPAHERSVNVGLGHELLHVIGLDAAAVLDPDVLGRVACVERGQQTPDKGVD